MENKLHQVKILLLGLKDRDPFENNIRNNLSVFLITLRLIIINYSIIRTIVIVNNEFHSLKFLHINFTFFSVKMS